ncbi:MAG TPA: oligosaccharide flippase family protein [Nitrososphaeraceae archaeon]|nr:oligosaccharide flippase family protein [Nitrososphaeraceae archaeon]
MDQLDGHAIGRGAGYIFVETIIGFLSGYLLWLVLTRITTPEIIGISSTVVSLCGIFIVIAEIGVDKGSSRILARYFHDNNLKKARMYVKVSLILVCIGTLSSVSFLLIFKDWISPSLGIPMIYFAMLIIGSSTVGILLHVIVIASLKTKVIPKVMVVASSSRTIIVIVLVLAQAGAVGIVLGYSFYQILASILLAFAVLNLLRNKENKKNTEKTTNAFKTVLIASVPSWIPKLISVIGGANLGTVIVFGSNGASEAAAFFLANTILSGIITVVTPLYTISFPALSAMDDYRKRFTWRVIKVSMVILSPLSLAVIFYSPEVINLLGQDYSNASIFLRILLLTALVSPLSTMINQLIYAYGNYRLVLYLGLASNIPRILLYFLLVPSFGGTGAAVSFLIGTMISFALTIRVAGDIQMNIHWKVFVLITVLPLLPAFLFNYFQINFIVGILATIVVSMLAFLKFNVLTKLDVEDSVNVLPKGIARPIILSLNKVGRILNKDY